MTFAFNYVFGYLSHYSGTESLTAHIRVLSDDRIPSRSHELLDAQVLKMLDQEKFKHLKDPGVREDYVGIVELVAIAFECFEEIGTLEYAKKKNKSRVQ